MRTEQRVRISRRGTEMQPLTDAKALRRLWDGGGIMIVVYLRNVVTEVEQCWVVCAKGDPGAVAFEGFPASSVPPSHSGGK